MRYLVVSFCLTMCYKVVLNAVLPRPAVPSLLMCALVEFRVGVLGLRKGVMDFLRRLSI